MKKAQKTTNDNLEGRFDAGEDVLDYFSFKEVTVRVNMGFPAWMIKAIDKESSRRGVGRQALVRMWIADHIDALKSPSKNRGHLHRKSQI